MFNTTMLCITGHRPEKIENPDEVRAYMLLAYQVIAPDSVIQGMASGVDLWSAKLANSVGIPFWAVRPWAGHGPRKSDRLMYDGAMRDAALIHNVSPSLHYPGPWIYQKRNEWMVDHTNTVLAVWDGSSGGTKNCLDYAVKQGRKICHLDPNALTLEWL